MNKDFIRINISNIYRSVLQVKWKTIILVYFLCSQVLFGQDRQAELDQYRMRYTVDNLQQGDRSPYSADDTLYLDFYDLDTSFIFQCQFKPADTEDSFEMELYSGKTRTYIKKGYIEFEVDGESRQLALYQDRRFIVHPVYKNNLFLPFKDLTNGVTTYGGGRYLELNKLQIEDQKIEVNFNFAYNPWCVYSDGFNCPIPPIENHLDIAIHAGEKNYKKSYDESKH